MGLIIYCGQSASKIVEKTSISIALKEAADEILKLRKQQECAKQFIEENVENKKKIKDFFEQVDSIK